MTTPRIRLESLKRGRGFYSYEAIYKGLKAEKINLTHPAVSGVDCTSHYLIALNFLMMLENKNL